MSNGEDKQGMARHLFEYKYFTYDLDRQEIVDFRLKGWADQFLVLRIALYADESKDDHQGDDHRVVPTGRRTFPRYFKTEFIFSRAKYQARSRPLDPAKMEIGA